MSTFSWNDLKKAAEDAGFVVIPAGTYNAVITKSDASKKTQGGKDQIKVTFKVLDGPNAGKPVSTQFVLSPENPTALGFFFRHMKALGLEGSYFASLPTGQAGLNQAANDLIGKTCQIVVTIDQWNGEDRNKIDGVKSMLGAPGVSATPSGMPQPVAQPQPMAQPRPQPVAAAKPVAQPAPAVSAQKSTPAPEDTGLIAEIEKELAAGEPVGAVSGIPAPPNLPF